MQTELQLSLNEPLIRPLVPVKFRAPVDILWRLEARLDRVSSTGKEPTLRQIKLAWWRDALAALDAKNDRVPDEPLLRDIASVLRPHLSGTQLADHAEARLTALSSQWTPDDVMAAGQSLFALSATLMGQAGGTRGGAQYALTATALMVDDAPDRERLFAAAMGSPMATGQPRALAVLDRLARQIARHDGNRSQMREQALILRVGLFGR